MPLFSEELFLKPCSHPRPYLIKGDLFLFKLLFNSSEALMLENSDDIELEIFLTLS